MELSSNQVEEIVHDTIEPKLGWFNRWFPIFQWSKSTPEDIKNAEEELLSCKAISFGPILAKFLL